MFRYRIEGLRIDGRRRQFVIALVFQIGIGGFCAAPATAGQVVSLQDIIGTGDPVDGGGTIGSELFPPLFNAQGRFVCLAKINAATGTTYRLLLWDGRKVMSLVSSDDAAPGGPDLFFGPSSFSNFVFSSSGEVVFAGQLFGTGVDPSNDSGLYRAAESDLEYLAREGDAAAGAGTGVLFDELGLSGTSTRPQIGGPGDAIFAARLMGVGVTSANVAGIWRITPSGQELMARYGDVAPGLAETFTQFWEPRMNDSGDFIFAASATFLDIPTGYWMGGPDQGVHLALQAGFTTPQLPIGAQVGSFGLRPLLAADGTVAFAAQMTGLGITPANDETLWIMRDSKLTLLASDGDAAPGLPRGTTMISPSPVAISPIGTLLVTGGLANPGIAGQPGTALWFVSGDAWELVALSGQQAPGSQAGIVFKYFVPQGVGEHVYAVNATGQVLLSAALSELGSNSYKGVYGWSSSAGLFPVAPALGEIVTAGGERIFIDGAQFVGEEGGISGGQATGLAQDGRFALRVTTLGNQHAIYAGEFPSPADFNGDGEVNGIDLAILLGAWGPCSRCVQDLDGNGIVNGFDLALLLGEWD